MTQWKFKKKKKNFCASLASTFFFQSDISKCLSSEAFQFLKKSLEIIRARIFHLSLE